MIEGVLAGIISNLLTDYGKRVFGLEPAVVESTSTSKEGDRIDGAETIYDEARSNLDRRREANRRKAEGYFFIVAMVVGFALWLLLAVAIPIAFKNLSGSFIDFGDTRLSFIPGAVSKTWLSVIMVVLAYIPLFVISERMAQRLASWFHHEWMDVTQWKYLRIFLASGFFVSALLMVVFLYALNPGLSLKSAALLVFIGSLLLLVYALQEKRT